jgi:hypothetical protein
VFATDAYHEQRHEFGRELGTSIKYLKPTVVDDEEAIDPLAAVHLPWFFTGFKWKDVNGQERTVSLALTWSGGVDGILTMFRCLAGPCVALGRSPSIDCSTMLVFKREIWTLRARTWNGVKRSLSGYVCLPE